MKFIAQTKLPSLIVRPESIDLSKIVEIPIRPASWGLQKNCVLNVQEHVSRIGGVAQFGWVFSTLGTVAIRFVGHCAVKDNDGMIFCVTPPENIYIEKIGFIPDDSIAIDPGSGDRLPSFSLPLINDSYVKEYCELENLMQVIRQKYPARKSLDDRTSGVAMTPDDSIVTTIIHEKSQRLLPLLGKVVRKSYEPDQYCFCDSGKKFKMCCMEL